ncbi:hypothetical protein WJX72_007873 [[Myrmecia] bisecta]|uniref:CRAL-TRIO domain-containing protein n=1 Tax=[Myrmecia] bisecta TaxID=41462 RepID=A0AAW1QAW3_9CHLO
MTEAEHLTTMQEQAVADLRVAVQATLEASAPLRYWCTDSTLVRYLRARNWDLNKAIKMLKATMEWRLTYKPHEITWAEVKHEASTGKQFRMQARDRDGRVVLVMRPRCQNSTDYVKGIRMLVYHLEASSRAADQEGVGKMTWLIDFEGYTMATAPPLKVAMQTVSILQNHYPERLGLSVYYHPPRLFNLMWKAVRPFVDPEAVADLRAAVADKLASHAHLRYWCTDSTLVRYLRARNWDLNKAIKMLKATIEWRLTYKPHEITWAEVKHEASTGKQFRMQARDRDGRVVLVMRPRCQNSTDYVAGIRMLVYHLEASSQAADREGVGKMTWLIDFEGYTMANAPPLKVAMQTASILQNHFPERLGLSVYYHAPRLFNLMWKAVRPFIDAVTLRKHGWENDMVVGRSVPWSSWRDWMQVREWLFGQSAEEFQRALDLVAAWRCRGRVPLGADLTAALIEIRLRDPAVVPGRSLPSHTSSEAVLQLQYAMVIIRLVNGIVDSAQKGKVAISVANLAAHAGLPRLLVDVRHDATHSELPTLALLRLAASQALTWLQTAYWQRQADHLQACQLRIGQILVEYMGLRRAAAEKLLSGGQAMATLADDEYESDAEGNSQASEQYQGAEGQKQRRALMSELKTLVHASAAAQLVPALLDEGSLDPPVGGSRREAEASESGRPAKRWRRVDSWIPCPIGAAPSLFDANGAPPSLWLSPSGQPTPSMDLQQHANVQEGAHVPVADGTRPSGDAAASAARHARAHDHEMPDQLCPDADGTEVADAAMQQALGTVACVRDGQVGPSRTEEMHAETNGLHGEGASVLVDHTADAGCATVPTPLDKMLQAFTPGSKQRLQSSIKLL